MSAAIAAVVGVQFERQSRGNAAAALTTTHAIRGRARMADSESTRTPRITEHRRAYMVAYRAAHKEQARAHANSATIYILVDNRRSETAGRVRYVGQTRIEITRRLARHWVTALAGAKEHRAAWMRSMLASGAEVLIEAIDCVPPDKADAAEQAHIARFVALGCDLTNRTEGGRGRRGWEVSEATRRKMSASAKRKAPPSPETRAKMGAALRASPRHKAHLKRLHRLNQRPCSPETRRNISAALRGDGNGQAVLTWEAAEDIRARYAAGERQSDLARAFHCSPSTILNVRLGRSWVRA